MDLEKIDRYELKDKRFIPDLNSYGYLMKHKKSGARVMVLENDDNNKVFYIGFRTPPFDSTGTPHILEHTVLCGSEKFPVKDPFVELVKGSLNTFLNAMTYPDKTVYPVASVNDKDFANLMDVYMDACLHPNIYKERKIFEQEGWHYELGDKSDALMLNGVVYNEMKGAFSNPDDVLSRFILNALFPHTEYALESGGDPKDIPKLTYENFLSMHQKYYHPSNSYIYLYGNSNMAERLDWLDREYLSKYDKADIDSEIKREEAFKEPVYLEKEYAISPDESEEKNTYLSYSACIGNNLDPELYLAFQIIEYALLDVPGAPLNQALLDAKIGSDIEGTYDNGICQPYFSIIAKNADGADRERFLEVIKNVLQEVADKGFDKKALLSGLNYFEFKYREADFGSYPKGLMYGLQALDSWLYDEGKPFVHIAENDTFKALKAHLEDGSRYFENLVDRYLIHNPHSAIVTLRPVKGLAEKEQAETDKRLAAYKEGLSDEEIEAIIKDTKDLKAYQDEPSTQEQLMTIPLLSISDIERQAEGFINKDEERDGTLCLHHEIFTNGIAYLNLIFDIEDLPGVYLPYLAIYKNVLTSIGTEHYSYQELNHEINLNSGGIDLNISTYSDVRQSGVFRKTFEVKGRFLEEKIGFGFDIMKEILLTSKFEDKKRLKELISMMKSRMGEQLVSAGHMSAVGRCMSYFSPVGQYAEVCTGISLYDLVCELDKDFDSRVDELVGILKEISAFILQKSNFVLDLTGSAAAYKQAVELMASFKSALSDSFAPGLISKDKDLSPWSFMPKTLNEGFKTSAAVQFVAKCANFAGGSLRYTGALQVLKVMLGYDYLWQNVRVKGGAYGCMSGFARNGECYMASYRDPHLKSTIQVFNDAADYIASFKVSDRDMRKYVIGAISNMDTPLPPKAKGARSLAAYMGHLTEEDYQRERDEILSCDQKAIRGLASYVEAIKSTSHVCCIGAAEKIEQNKELFLNVRSLK